MVLLYLFFLSASSFEIELPSKEIFCLGEELGSQILIVGDIETSPMVDFLSISVTSPMSELLFSKNLTNFAKFSFTALESGTHSVCLDNQGAISIPITVDIRTGVRAKDYSNIASTKEMKELDYRIKMYEDLIKQIHSRMQVLREREEQMRTTNLTIHSRVISYSICTVVLLLALAVVQILYLKKFFRAKKMI